MQSVDDLIELSIVSGNDFTGHFMRGPLKGKIGIQGRVQIQDLATWVKRMRRVENHDAIVREMVNVGVVRTEQN